MGLTQSSVPQHCLLFDSVTTNFYSHRPILFDQARSSDDNSKYELLEEPALQALHRRLHDCETFQSILARASGFDLNEIDMLGETILFKAIRSDDVDLGR